MDTPKTLYRIDDPFLAFWYRFVEPNRSTLERRPVASVARSIQPEFLRHVAEIWEDLARRAVPHLSVAGMSWKPAARWWGAGSDRQPLEVDVVAESNDGMSLLVGEAKLAMGASELARAVAALDAKVERLPFVKDYREVHRRLFVADVPARTRSVVSGKQVLAALR